MTRDHRRLAAIVSADVVGYSLLMGRDDSATLAGLKAHRRELIDPKIAEYGGRIVKTTGDGLLLEFPSVVDAVRCAVDVQRGMAERNAGMSPEQRIDFRIGINVGDIIIDGEDIFGDGVNVAARLETLADPGGICVSRVVRDQVLDKLNFAFEDLGPQEVKNIARPVEVYRVDLGSGVAQAPGRSRWRGLRRAVGSRALVASVLALGVAGIIVGVVGTAGGIGGLWELLRVRGHESRPLGENDGLKAMSLALGNIAAQANDEKSASAARSLMQDLGAGIGSFERQVRLIAVPEVDNPKSSSAFVDTARRAGARYVVNGYVGLAASGLSVDLRLVDVESGAQVWSGRFAMPQASESDEGKAATRQLVRKLVEALRSAEIRRVSAMPVNQLDAAELAVRASGVQEEEKSLANLNEARSLVDRALRLESDSVPALLEKAYVLNRLTMIAPKGTSGGDMAELDALTTRLVALDHDDWRVWVLRVYVLESHGRWNPALDASEYVIKLDPYNDFGYLNRAWLLVVTGRPSEALPLIAQALTLKPSNPAWGPWLECEAHLLLGDTAETIRSCERTIALDPTDYIPYSYLAAAYANAGDMAHARDALNSVLKSVPNYTIELAMRESDHPAYRQLAEKYWAEGLRKLGVPEK